MEPLLVAFQQERVRRWGAAFLAVLLALPAMWPFLGHAGYWASHDGHFHLYRLLSLEAAWRQGHFYPRTFPDFAFGYGFAVLNFYGPLTYYVALALSGVASSIAALKLTFAASYPLAALSIWWFARDLWRQKGDTPNEVAGLVAASAYTYLPYHMADVQLRGALAESWAFVWWPLLFWAAWRGRRWPFALVLAALVLTHNLSVVLVAVPLAVWALLAALTSVNGPTRPARVHLRELAIGAAIALLVTAFYWLPVVLESRSVWISQDVGGLGFANHLAAWREWIAPSATYHYFPDQSVAGEHPLSWAQLGLLALALAALPALWRGPWRVPVLFWWGTLIISLFLLTPAAYPLWKSLVFPFGLVQYPWRWLGLVALATAILASAPLAVLHRPSSIVHRRLFAVTLTLTLVWLGFSSMQHLPWQPREVETRLHPAPMWAEDVAAEQVGATWTAEFLPLSVTEQRWALTRAPETVTGVGEGTPLRVTQAQSDGFSLWADVQADEAAWLTFPRFAYLSMRGTMDGEARPVAPRGALGLAAIEVPAGTHRVTLAASPLADRAWLRWLLWVPPLGLVLYGLARLGQGGVATGGVAALLLLALLVTREPDAIAAPQEVNAPLQWGAQAQLLSVRLDDPAPATGDALKVTLLWFNLVQTDQHYSTFVHLTAKGGGPALVPHDNEPNLGTVPTPRWLPGQLVEDLHILPLPDDLPPGEYELWGGMYAVADGAAVPLPGDSGERRLLGTVQVR